METKNDLTELYTDYLEITGGDKPAAAMLVLADTIKDVARYLAEEITDN